MFSRSIFLPLFLVAFCFGVARINGAPIDSKDTSEPPAEENQDYKEGKHKDFYDQRQNGTENLWVTLNGVLIIVAPAETVLHAAQLANFESDLYHITTESSGLKPKPRPPFPGDKSAIVEENPINKEQISRSHQTKELSKEKQVRLLNLLKIFKGIKQEISKTSLDVKR